ncbi:MAG: hypothetical protein ABIV48_04755 [Pyrinomonadaceae bacterium]
MNRIKRLIAISAFSLLVLSLPAIASAQSRNRDRDHDNHDDDYYSNDDRYRNNRNRNGGYDDDHYGNNNGYNGNMRSVVRSLKANTRELQRHLDRDLDNSRHNGSRREDHVNQESRDFRNAVNRLSESNNGPRENDVRRVLELGRHLEQSLVSTGVINHVSQSWSRVRSDLRTLENGYNYNNNGRYPDNRYPQNRNTRNNLPSWWPF